jgi:CBS domain-containing protein
MQVSDIMTRGCECIAPDASLQEAARKMRDLNVGPLPVCSDKERLVGILTDRDIAVRAIAEGLDPRIARVDQVMTPGIVFCFEDQDIEEAAQIMEEKQIRRLVVLNRNKRMVGIVSLGDLAVAANDENLAGEALECISEPVHAGR